jgi:hypothetical protein
VKYRASIVRSMLFAAVWACCFTPVVLPVGTTLTSRTVNEKFPTGGAELAPDPPGVGVSVLSLDRSRMSKAAATPSTTTRIVP